MLDHRFHLGADVGLVQAGEGNGGLREPGLYAEPVIQQENAGEPLLMGIAGEQGAPVPLLPGQAAAELVGLVQQADQAFGLFIGHVVLIPLQAARHGGQGLLGHPAHVGLVQGSDGAVAQQDENQSGQQGQPEKLECPKTARGIDALFHGVTPRARSASRPYRVKMVRVVPSDSISARVWVRAWANSLWVFF